MTDTEQVASSNLGALDVTSSAHVPSDVCGSAVRCSRCGCDAAPATNCEQCGAFLPGNEAALRHGLRRYQVNGTLPAEVAEYIETFREQLIADQGGEAELTAVRAGMIEKLVDLEVGSKLLMAEVVKRRIDSKPGRQAYTLLLGTLDRWHRYAVSLGTGRRAKRVPSIAEAMAGKEGTR